MLRTNRPYPTCGLSKEFMPSFALRPLVRIGLRDFLTCGGALRVIFAATSLVVFQFSAGCGGNRSGSSGGSPPPPPTNPVPAIVSLSPSSQNAGATAFALTVAGENFISSSTVQWNGSPRTTTYSSSGQLQVQINASDIASSGTAAVSVINPAPGGGDSGSAELIISATSNAVPSLTSLGPSSVIAGTSGFILTLNGSNFLPASSIEWNGAALPATYLSGTQLEVQIPASAIAAPGFADVAVLNPAPGGGASTSLVFAITYAPMIVSQLANDLVWDSTHQVIYLSVPSLAASNGNTVSVLNPMTGSITSSQFAGSEPDVLAIDSENEFLYMGLDGSSSVQRFALPDLVPDISYSLGTDGVLGPTFAWDLQVAPGLAHTTAVSRGIFSSSPYSAAAGMTIYDDATPRPTTTGDREGVFDSLQWASDTTIYAINSEDTSYDLYVLTVSSGGVVVTKDYPNEFSNLGVTMHYDSGTQLVYTDDGYVINPTNGQQVGTFQAAGLMVPDSTLNSAFFLGQTESQFGTTNFTIESFDLTTLAPTAEIVVPNVQGDPLHFILWGTNGLAFNDDAGYVYILNNPFVAADGSQVKMPLRYLSPIAKTKSRPKMIRQTKVVARRSSPIPKAGKHSYESLDSSPVPSITALSPSAVTAGVNGFTLTVTGTNLLSLSTVQWNGSQLPTEYVSSGQLQAQVSASDVATAASVSVTVVTPSPGGGTSTTLPFGVVPASSPAPVVLGFDPTFVAAGSPGFTLSMSGLTNSFDATSVVQWNGSPRAASLSPQGQLQIQVSASDIATAGFAQITISNPGPGGGTTTVEYQVLYQPAVVTQATNDLVWDPVNQVIYISVPGSASTHANQVCILNPTTAAIVTCQAAGSEPDVLAISEDSQFLYVGEDGTGTVQRFTLPGLVPDITYSLGNYDSAQSYYALDLQVAPGAPHTTAVSKGVLDTSGPAVGGITIFDDSTPRPTSTPEDGYPGGGAFGSIQWGSDATALYAANNESTGYDFYTLTVSSSGVVLNYDYPSVFWNPGRIHYDSGTGLVYSDDGYHAIDPSTGLPAGIFEVGGGWPLAPDSALNTVFGLSKYVWQGNANFTIEILDMTHYTFMNRVPFSAAQDDLTGLNRFIRWGTNGLAVNDTAGNLYLISGPFVSGDQQSGPQRLVKPVRHNVGR
jgi:trimeric autotransporter adhesin